jgi:hypothetical protein
VDLATRKLTGGHLETEFEKNKNKLAAFKY